MRHARIAAIGFALTLLLALGITAFALHALRRVVSIEEAARREALVLADAERLRYLVAQKVASNRAFLLTGQPHFVEHVQARREDFLQLLSQLRAQVRSEEGQRLLTGIQEAEAAHQAVVQKAITLREQTRTARDEMSVFLQEVQPLRDALHHELDALEQLTRQEMERKHTEATDAVAHRQWMVGTTSGVVLLLGVVLAAFLTLSIARRDEAERRLADEVIRQSREMESAFAQMRGERDEARRQAGRLERPG